MTHAFDLGGIELGVATAATQIEGGQADTIWHRWATKTGGGAVDGSSPAVACDHWNRVREDTELLASLGIQHYRLGLEWARIEPRPGEFDPAAIEHYRAELTALRAAGITPLVTLHHFNDPGWFSDAGGFLGPEAISYFCNYVEYVAKQLGDLASEWITINEPNVFALAGYYEGNWPPGRRSVRDFLRIQTEFARAHIHAYQLLHRSIPDAQVGFAQHLRYFEPADPTKRFDRASARLVRHLFQDAGTTAAITGHFQAPLLRPADIRRGRYADFLGVNYYTGSQISGLNYRTAANVPVNDLGWEISAIGFTEVLSRYHQQYRLPIYVTENGTADRSDAFRARYLYDHLRAAASSGLPIKRYYHWTFIDNWEWAEGQTGRFGLVELDFNTQQRSVRPSGHFYADVIANHGVTEDAYQRWVAGQHYPRNG